MISSRRINNTIRISCSKNQLIDTKQLKKMYRTGLRFLAQHGNTPIIVDAEKNVRLSDSAKKIFKRIDARCSDTTLIIISG